METLVQSYAEGYNKLVQAIEGVTDEELLFKPAPEKWSIKEVVIHVCDAEMVGVDRMKRTLSEPNPLLFKFDPDAWASRMDYQSLDMQLYLTLFQALRASMVSVLTALKPEDWERTAVHNVTGKHTLEDIVRMFDRHVDTHIRQIERNKQAYAAVVR
ncbi:DinB family protein [Paenibacillus validus]|nr:MULTISPECIES: DinB family protein [Paenibacillus]MED4602386.1 DinB family protein [Paenibacillus validus]MED4608911.1 DinB family protein [Paenibacillus validus]